MAYFIKYLEYKRIPSIRRVLFMWIGFHGIRDYCDFEM